MLTTPLTDPLDASGSSAERRRGRLRRARRPWLLLLCAWTLACGLASDEGGDGDAPATPRAVVPLPASRGGQDLIGTPWPALDFDRWIDGPAEAAPPVATLYRWWTDSCPFCVASLPAFETLRVRHAADGLRVVAVYHPKPPRPVGDEAVRRAAGERGFHGPLAVDSDWSELDRCYLSTGRRSATSAAFLIDGDGVLRFVHPGPELHPTDDPEHALCAADFAALEAAVAVVLGLPVDSSSD